MKRLLVLILMLVFFFSPFTNIPLIPAEHNPGNYSNSETSEKRAEPNPFAEYQRVQEELWRDYSKLRDWLVNGYLSEMLKIKYEELKLGKRALVHEYLEGKNKLLGKYLDEKKS
ncbi:MAG: hypothetical protein ACRENF_00265 [Thermodesulfobacteriota bacterium]